MITVIAFGAAVIVCLIILGEILKAWIPRAGYTPPPPSDGTLLTKLGQVILDYNNSQAYWVGGATSYTVAAKGVTVHKIDAQQAQAIADELAKVVPASAPMSIPCALMASESIMDPLCENGNYLGSNPTKDPLGFDDGACQLKLRYLIGVRPGVTDAATAQAYAFDVTQAIPYFWAILNTHLATGDSWIAAGGPSNIDQRLMNRWVLGALIFKQGVTGARALFEAGTWPPELANFLSLESFFAGKLGTPSVFASLPQ